MGSGGSFAPILGLFELTRGSGHQRRQWSGLGTGVDPARMELVGWNAPTYQRTKVLR